MRRYQDTDDLRKLHPATTGSFANAGKKRPELTNEELDEAEIKHYAIIDAAAAIASSKVDDRLTRLFFGVIGFLTAVGGGIYFTLDQQIRSTASEVVNDEFDRRGNAIFGFFALQRRLMDIDRRFEFEIDEQQEIAREQDESRRDTRQSSRILIDGVTRELSSFMAVLNGESDKKVPAADDYTITSADRIFMESEISDSITSVARFSRGVTYYEPITKLYFASPQIAMLSEDFLIDFTYASGFMLISDPFVSRDSLAAQDLYAAHRDARRFLTGWPELTVLYSMLIEAQLGATPEQLARVGQQMDELNDVDFESMLMMIAEIGFDSKIDPNYKLAGERTIATLMNGCGVGGFIPTSVCVRFENFGIEEYFGASANTGSLTSVGLSPSGSLLAGDTAWSTGIGGHVGSEHPGAKGAREKEAYLDKVGLR